MGRASRLRILAQACAESFRETPRNASTLGACHIAGTRLPFAARNTNTNEGPSSSSTLANLRVPSSFLNNPCVPRGTSVPHKRASAVQPPDQACPLNFLRTFHFPAPVLETPSRCTLVTPARSHPLPLPTYSSPGSIRQLATSGAPPGAVLQQKQLRVFLQSPGILADPYRPPPPPLPLFKRFFTREGWRRMREGLMDALRTGYAIAILRQNTKGYTRRGFYSDIAHSYSKINQALASDDRTALRHYVTEKAFSGLKGQLKSRQQGGVRRAEWKLVGGAPKMTTLQARLVALDPKKPDNSFIQVTLRIQSTQIVALYDSKGLVLAGDPSSEIPVEDIWVWERHLKQPSSQWRLCGQVMNQPK